VEVSGQLHAAAALPPGKEPSGRIGGWVGPKSGWDEAAKRIIPIIALAGN